MTVVIEHLRSWIWRTETADDTVTPAPLRALTATLDRDDPPLRDHRRGLLRPRR